MGNGRTFEESVEFFDVQVNQSQGLVHVHDQILLGVNKVYEEACLRLVDGSILVLVELEAQVDVHNHASHVA